MYIRELRRADIPQVATIFCDAFYNDEFFEFVAPYRDRFPLSWRRYAVEKQQVVIVTPGYYGFVCVSDGRDGKGEQDEILGYAWWRRAAAKEENTDRYMQNNKTIGATAERMLRTLEMKYKNFFVPNLVECRSNKDVIDIAVADTRALKPIDDVTHWHLSALAVASKHQRKGVGRILVQWGVEKARDESLAAPEKPPVPATLTASASGRYLYEQLGFKVIGWKAGILEQWGRAMLYDPSQHRKELHEIYHKVMDGKEQGAGGGSSMVFDPIGYWIEPAPEGTLFLGREVDVVWTAAARKGT